MLLKLLKKEQNYGSYLATIKGLQLTIITEHRKYSSYNSKPALHLLVDFLKEIASIAHNQVLIGKQPCFVSLKCSNSNVLPISEQQALSSMWVLGFICPLFNDAGNKVQKPALKRIKALQSFLLGILLCLEVSKTTLLLYINSPDYSVSWLQIFQLYWIAS